MRQICRLFQSFRVSNWGTKVRKKCGMCKYWSGFSTVVFSLSSRLVINCAFIVYLLCVYCARIVRVLCVNSACIVRNLLTI